MRALWIVTMLMFAAAGTATAIPLFNVGFDQPGEGVNDGTAPDVQAAAAAPTVNLYPTYSSSAYRVFTHKTAGLVTLGASDGSDNIAIVQADKLTGGGKTLRFMGNAADRMSSGQFQIDMDLLLHPADNGSGVLHLYARTDDESWAKKNELYFNLGGTSYLVASGAWQSINVSGVFVPEKILHLTWALDLDNVTQTLTISNITDGTSMTDTQSIEAGNTLQGIDLDTSDLAFSVNNVVTSVPEPATMALLGLGALLIRKRK